MTIEEGLDELVEKNREKAKQVPEEPSKSNPTLIKIAQEALGDFLVNQFHDIASNQITEFMRTIGPFVLTIEPQKDYQQKVSITSEMDRNTWYQVLGTLADGYLLNTDAKEFPEEVINFSKQGELYFPEMQAIKAGAIPTQLWTPIISPYALVMGLSPKHRALAAAAVHIGLQKKEAIEYNGSFEDHEKKKLIMSCVPTLKHLAEAAKEYNVTEISQVNQDLNRIIVRYDNAWT